MPIQFIPNPQQPTGTPSPQPSPTTPQPQQPTQPSPRPGSIQFIPKGQQPPSVGAPTMPRMPSEPPTRGEQILGAIGNVLHPIEAARETIAAHTPDWIGKPFQTVVEHPVGWALAVMGKPAEMTEHAITGGKGYDAWLGDVEQKAIKAGLPIQPMTPAQREIAGLSLRVILDPTNLLMFPGAIEKGLTIGAKGASFAGRGVRTATTVTARVAQDAEAFARANGLETPIAKAHAIMEAGLASEPMQAGLGALRQAHQYMAQATDATISLFDRTHGLGPVQGLVKQFFREWNGERFNVAVETRRLQFSLMRDVPDTADRELLYHVFDGGLSETSIPDRLQAAWLRAKKVIDDHTAKALEGGYIDHALSNYIKHAYSPDDLQSIKGMSNAPSATQAGMMQGRVGPGLGTTIGASHKRAFVDAATAEAHGYKIIKDTATAIPLHNLELGLAEANRNLLVKIVQRLRGTGYVHLAGEAPEGYIGFDKIVGGPTAERTVVEGARPTPAPQVQQRLVRAQTSDEVATHLQGRASALRSRNLETPRPGVAEEADRLDKLSNDVRGMSAQDAERAAAQAGHPYPGRYVNPRVAEPPPPAPGSLLSHYRVHPQLAEALDGLITKNGRRSSKMFQMYGNVLHNYKWATFYFPMVHAWNVMRSAYLADGLRPFNISRWQEMVHDVENNGEWSRAFLRDGGSVSAGANREFRNVYENLMDNSDITRTLARDGISWKDIAKSPMKVYGVLKEKSDDFLWNKMDRTFRTSIYRDFVENGVLGPGGKMTKITGPDAARLATSYMNDYSRDMMTGAERNFAQVFFTYAWNKGRAQLFGNMARSLIPGTALSAGERAAYQAGVMRWAIINQFAPHVYRAVANRAQIEADPNANWSAGVWGATIPVGARTDPRGFQTPLYVDPTGYYGDVGQFFANPVSYTTGRLNPAARLAADIIVAAYNARTTGQPEATAALGVLPRFAPLPAGVPQAFTPGMPLAARVLSAFGQPTRTTPPKSEDAHFEMYQAYTSGDYVTAARIIHDYNLGATYTIGRLPAAVRGPMWLAYNHLYPSRRAAGTSIPGIGGGATGGVPGFGGTSSTTPPGF